MAIDDDNGNGMGARFDPTHTNTTNQHRISFLLRRFFRSLSLLSTAQQWFIFQR